MNFPSKEAKMLGQIKPEVPVVERRPCAVNKENDPPPSGYSCCMLVVGTCRFLINCC